MESSRIHILKQGDPIFSPVEMRLLEEKGITRNEIREIAKKISEEIKKRLLTNQTNSLHISVILNFFDSHTLFLLLNEQADLENSGHLSMEEIESAIKPIQQFLIQELKKLIPEFDWYSLGKKLETTEKPIHHISDQYIYKEKRDYVKQENHEAINAFYNLEERCPFIAYHHRKRDNQSGHEISKKIEMTTIDDLLMENYNLFDQIIWYFSDNIRAVKFIFDHGFVVSDLSPDNLGVDLNSNFGMLFDLDALQLENKAMTDSYLCKRDYVAPEFHSFKYPIDVKGHYSFEPQAVYELGLALQEILGAPQFNQPNQPNTTLQSFCFFLSRKMRSMNPANRPRIHEVLQLLDQQLTLIT